MRGDPEVSRVLVLKWVVPRMFEVEEKILSISFARENNFLEARRFILNPQRESERKMVHCFTMAVIFEWGESCILGRKG